MTGKAVGPTAELLSLPLPLCLALPLLQRAHLGAPTPSPGFAEAPQPAGCPGRDPGVALTGQAMGLGPDPSLPQFPRL